MAMIVHYWLVGVDEEFYRFKTRDEALLYLEDMVLEGRAPHRLCLLRAQGVDFQIDTQMTITLAEDEGDDMKEMD